MEFLFSKSTAFTYQGMSVTPVHSLIPCCISRCRAAQSTVWCWSRTAAAKDRERRGVGGITSNCGYLIRYQKAVSDAVRVPVFLSSLLQLPMVVASVGASRSVGVIAAHAGKLGKDLLGLAGIDEHGSVVVAGMEDQPEFRRSMIEISSPLDAHGVEQETVQVAEKRQRNNFSVISGPVVGQDPPCLAVRVQKGTGP